MWAAGSILRHFVHLLIYEEECLEGSGGEKQKSAGFCRRSFAFDVSNLLLHSLSQSNSSDVLERNLEMHEQYLVALPLDPMDPGATFAPGEQLPLHCTLMHWFTIEYKNPEQIILMEFERILRENGPLTIMLVSIHAGWFGPNEDVPVHVLEHNDKLNLLHTQLLVRLAHNHAIFAEPRWIGAGYRPHVTKTTKALSSGDFYRATEIVIVRKNETGIKEIVGARSFVTQQA